MGEKIRKPYYITTAIAYASGKPHIGNTYEIILADAIARFKREEGYDVYFQTGTDEHGQKIEGKAKDAGMTPQAYVRAVRAERAEQLHEQGATWEASARAVGYADARSLRSRER